MNIHGQSQTMEGGRRIIRFMKRKKKSDRIFLIICFLIFSLVLLVIQEYGAIALFHSINNQRKTNIPKHLISNLLSVPEICPPRDESPHNSHCPKAVCVPIDRQAGLGHRLTNVLMGKILSMTLNLPLAGPELEHIGSHHGGYPGANMLFHLDEDEDIVQCPTKGWPSGYEAPEDWNLHMLNSEEFTLNSFDFGSDDAALNINSLPYGNPNLHFTGAEDDGCAAIEELREIVNTAGCHTLFISGQFYPRTYLATHEFVRSIYRGEEPEVSNNLLTHYLYEEDTFNIAVHVRDGGDVVSKDGRDSYFTSIIRTALKEIAPTKIRVTIYVFSENPEPHLMPMREVAAESGLEFVDVIGEDGQLSAIETFMHFMKSDVFIGSDSSFSWMVNYIAGGSGRPVVVATGNAAGDYSKTYSPGNLIGTFDSTIGAFDGTISPSGQIFVAARKWKKSKRKEH